MCSGGRAFYTLSLYGIKMEIVRSFVYLPEICFVTEKRERYFHGVLFLETQLLFLKIFATLTLLKASTSCANYGRILLTKLA